jgi:hypothetical protein
MFVVVGGGAAYLQYEGPPAPKPKIEAPLLVPKLADDLALPPPPARPIAAPDSSLEQPADLVPGRMLPKAAGDREAADVYAAARPNAGDLPRISLVVDGVGVDSELSRQAIDLPYQVDLAFSANAPAGEELTKLVAEARKAGHECLVSIPLSVTGVSPSFSSTDIFASGTQAQNDANLQRALSNVRGCVGATSASDGKTGYEFGRSAKQALIDLVAKIEQRGLLYLDARLDPALEEPPGPPLEPPLADNPHLRRVTVAINITPERGPTISPSQLEENLGDLEHHAANFKSAVGLISLATESDKDKGETLKEIKEWLTREVEKHEFKLVSLRYASPPPVETPAPPGPSKPPE